MVDRTTDGAGSAAVDPGGRSDAWESVLGSAMADSGIDPNATLDQLDDPDADPPQPDGAESSAAPAATPRATDAGDDGAATPEAADPAEDQDPLATADPFTFDVDGESRTVEGAYRIPGEGLYVPEDKVAAFQQFASQAERLGRLSQELTDRTQRYERLTEWTENGRTLTGPQAIEASRVAHGNALAELSTYKALLSDPAKLASLLTYDQETGVFGQNPDATARLAMEIENLQLKLAPQIRSHLSGLATPQPSAPAAFDAKANASQIVEHAVKASAVTGLSDADKQWAAQIAPRYVRAATVEDMKANPALKPGEPMLEAEFVDLLRERAQLRADAVKQASTAATAGKFNGGMNAGRTAPKPAPRPSATPAPAPAKVGKAEAWSNLLDSALQDIAL